MLHNSIFTHANTSLHSEEVSDQLFEMSYDNLIPFSRTEWTKSVKR